MVKNILLACVLTAAGGYLLGSILFGVLISKVMYNDDVRNHGSGNAGMTYVLRTYGKLPAVFTTLGDVGKSVAAVNLGRFIFGALLSGTGAAWQNPLDPVCGAYLAAIFCMIGHSRPIFFGFKGGKGVLVGAGAALATEPLVCAVLRAPQKSAPDRRAPRGRDNRSHCTAVQNPDPPNHDPARSIRA